MFCFCILAPISKVLFEITLIIKSGKTSQLLNFFKELYPVYSELSLLLSRPVFGAESGAKVRQIFLTTKLLPKFFSENISQNSFLSTPENRNSQKRVQSKTFFLSFPNISQSFFLTFLQPHTLKPKQTPEYHTYKPPNNRQTQFTDIRILYIGMLLYRAKKRDRPKSGGHVDK